MVLGAEEGHEEQFFSGATGDGVVASQAHCHARAHAHILVKHWKISLGSRMKWKELSASPCFADPLLGEVTNYRLFFFC